MSAHESFPACLPAGYSFPTLSQILNSAPQEKQSFPNILSQLRCEPATNFSPIATPLLHSPALSTRPHTWNAVNPNSGLCHRNIHRGQHGPPRGYRQGESVKGNSCQTAHIFTILGTANFLHIHEGGRIRETVFLCPGLEGQPTDERWTSHTFPLRFQSLPCPPQTWLFPSTYSINQSL